MRVKERGKLHEVALFILYNTSSFVSGIHNQYSEAF